MNYFDWIWSHFILSLGIQISLGQDPHMPLGSTTVSEIETRVSNIGWVLGVGMGGDVILYSELCSAGSLKL